MALTSGRTDQPAVQTLRARAHDLVVALEVVGVQRRDRETALAPPLIPLGGEHTDRADELPADALAQPRAPEALRTLAQRLVDRVRVRDHHHGPAAKLEGKDRTVTLTPLLDHLMKRRREHAVRDAHEAQPSRPGKVADRGRRRA